MRIEVHRHGGFAAIPAKDLRIDLDSGTLADEVAEQVLTAVALAAPDRAAATEPPTLPGGDRRIYDVALTDENGRREFRFVEPLQPEVRDLVALLLSLEAGR